MIIFPAIDLKGGEVVRLAEGDMDRATVYADDPAAQALLFAEQGAEFLHVPSRASPKMPRRLNISSRISPAMCSWAAGSGTGRRWNAGSIWALRGW
jgi:Histidine biosynthesis protein